MTEEWRVVQDAPDYEVSTLGRVARRAGTFRTPRRRVLRAQMNDHGYLLVSIPVSKRPQSRRIHQMVVDAFIRPRTPGEFVNHIDANKTNNRVENLEITDRAGNTEHARQMGLYRSGASHHATKLTDEDVRKLRRMFAEGYSGAEVARHFGINRNYAYTVNRGEERKAS